MPLSPDGSYCFALSSSVEPYHGRCKRATILSTKSLWLLCVDWQQLFDTSDVKILFYLQSCAGHEARYSDLLKNAVKTRSVLGTALQDLAKRKLIERIVEPTAPIQTKYKITDKGIRTWHLLMNLQKLVL